MSVVRDPSGARLTVLVGDALSRRTLGVTQRWQDDPDGVRVALDEHRITMVPEMPQPEHEALTRLQHAMSPRRCTLLTMATDGLLLKAGAADVIELYGSIWRLRCSADPTHPKCGIAGRQAPNQACAVCGAALRPDVVLPGDEPNQLAAAMDATRCSRVFLSVHAEPTHPVVTALLDAAKQAGARRWEIHPEPSPTLFDETMAEAATEGLPTLVHRWLREEA